MTVRPSKGALLSRLIVFLLPMFLAAYWPFVSAGHAVHFGVIALRVSLLACVAVLSLLWAAASMSSTEVRWSVIMACWLGVLLLPAFLGENVSRGIHNWLRVLPVCCIAILLARPLRHLGTRKALGGALGVAGGISLLFIVAIYLRYEGLSVPTYERLRVFKSIVQRSSGIALNPLGSATLMFCVLSLCLLRSGWANRALTVAIAIICSAFTGSRAPLALMLAGGAAVGITNLIHNRAMVVRAIACTAVCLMLSAAGILSVLLLTPEKLSAATEGRYDLWTVGMEKFLERPLAGYGPESWQDDLASRLPNYYSGTSGLETLRAGGYHSEFIALLAEGGLVCFVPAMIIFGLLFLACCRIAYHPATPRFNGQALIFAYFMFFFRSAVEVPGIFGYGEDVTDYLAAIFIAIVVSQSSLLSTRTHVRRGPVFGGLQALEQTV